MIKTPLRQALDQACLRSLHPVGFAEVGELDCVRGVGFATRVDAVSHLSDQRHIWRTQPRPILNELIRGPETAISAVNLMRPVVRVFIPMLIVLACQGCASRRTRLEPWRLVHRDAGDVLVPPDVAGPDATQRTVVWNRAGARGPCVSPAEAVALRVRRKTVAVTASVIGLTQQPAGWLGALAAHLEQQGCLDSGEGGKFAERMAQSLPMDPAAAFRLLYRDERETGQVDLVPQLRLRVVSPYWRRPGVGMIEGSMTVTGNDRNLNLLVTAKSAENLLGYERSFYRIDRKPTQAGYEITPLTAERHIDDQTENGVQPSVNYFPFSPEVRYFRLFFESWQNDFAALVVGARTLPELERRTTALEARGVSASCAALNGDMCIALPKEVAVTPMIAVTVNGAELLVGRGAKLSQAIRIAGVAQPDTVLGTLTVNKPWSERVMPVVFDRSAGSAILNMTLMGGESISWH